MSSPLVIEKPRCATCKKSVKNAVECNWCKKWEHKVCANLSDGDYVLLGSSSESVKFYCTYCAPKIGLALRFFTDSADRQKDIDSRLLSMESQLSDKFLLLESHFTKFADISNKFDSIELQLTEFQSTLAGLVDLPGLFDRIQDMESRLSKLLDAKFADMSMLFDTLANKFQFVDSSLAGLADAPKLYDKVRDLETQMSQLSDAQRSSLSSLESITSTPPSAQLLAAVDDITASVTAEQKEKEKRRFNVIVHNLPESSASDAQVRKDDDITQCTTLFKKYMNASVSVTNAVRLGKKGIRHDGTDVLDNGRDTRCRLLKITLNSHESKNVIMQSKHMLRNQSNPDSVRTLFITPDLTPLEQKKSKALRQQLTDMNRSGNAYVIKNGSIVWKKR